MKNFNKPLVVEIICGLLYFGTSIACLIASFSAVLAHFYIFASYGYWKWITLADLVIFFGFDPRFIIDPRHQWEWIGIGKAMNWAFYSLSVFVHIAIVWILFAAPYRLDRD